MTTLQEKLEKRVAEGFETARLCIRAKVGESKMLCPRTSVYYDELRDRARLLEASVDQVEDELAEFQALLVAEPASTAQVEIDLGDVVVTVPPPRVDDELPALLESTVVKAAKKKRGRKSVSE